MLDARLGPKFEDVAITTPSAEELASCTVGSVPGQAPGSAAWVLYDSKKQPVRRFFDSNGDDKVDVWSYYKDGVEVYREFDTANKGVPNNFRWLNAGGMKWAVGGVDNKGKGYVSTWRMISAEEASQEAFNAVARQDYARLQVLFITDAEMQALKLPASKVKGIQANQQGAQKKFADAVKAVAGAKFDAVESATPQCDSDTETIHFSNRLVRYELNKKPDFFNTGELIQVGMAWRLVDVPHSEVKPITPPPNPQLEALLKQLHDLDKEILPPVQTLENNPKVDRYYRTRITLVQQIIKLDDPKERENWYRQLFDNLMAMSQNSGDPTTIGMLTKMKDDVVASMPGSSLAGYGAYRAMWTTYSIEIAKVKPTDPHAKITELQEKWLSSLTDFVKKYNKAEDTPEALHQLAIGCEFSGKVEEAKRWYKQLSDNFPNHHLAPRAQGSEARLNLVGNAIKLNAPLLTDNAKSLDIASFKGKIVIVHYWASYTDQYKADFATLKQILDKNAKNVELISINLDDTSARAIDAVAKSQAPGYHLFQATNNAAGLNSPLATQYGIHILPTIFVVGRDGRVTNNNLQISDIDAELKKVQ
jgi:tetratricopeptide (TPR) repeat protein